MDRRYRRRVWRLRGNWLHRDTSRGWVCGFVSTRADLVPQLSVGDAGRRLSKGTWEVNEKTHTLEYVCEFESHASRRYVAWRNRYDPNGFVTWLWGASLVPLLGDDHARWRERTAGAWGDTNARLAFSDWLEDRQGVTFEVRLLRCKLFDAPYGRRPANPPDGAPAPRRSGRSG